MKLFEQFSGVTMAEDSVGRQVVCRVHKVGVGGRGFSGSTYSGLGVPDNAVVDIDESGLKQRREREDDRGRIAARVGDQTGFADRVAVQLRAPVDCLCLQPGCRFGTYVLQMVDGAIGVVFQTPCSAKVDDLD